MIHEELTGNTFGRIGRRQTTFVELFVPPSEKEPSYRISFAGKKEFYLEEADFKGVSLKVEHPLLLDYQKPWRNIFISKKSATPEALTEQLQETIESFFGGWRHPNHYLKNPRMLLTNGNGMLVRGPANLVELCSELLNANEIRHTILDSHNAEAESIQALFLGPFYIVADSFKCLKL
ncbi:hypothetical protein OAO01_03945 [Oligoflexia bacterium]|nr:hypothetical protein [Oligoflexia bacterium]